MKFIYTRCDSVVPLIPDGTVRALLCRVLSDGYLSESLILCSCVLQLDPSVKGYILDDNAIYQTFADGSCRSLQGVEFIAAWGMLFSGNIALRGPQIPRLVRATTW